MTDDEIRSGVHSGLPPVPSPNAGTAAERDAFFAGTVKKRRLPDDREGVTHKFCITSLGADGELVETKGYIQTGVYPDTGKLGEIFVKLDKPGGEGAVWDQFAILFSIALQHGVELEALCNKLKATRFAPSGATSNPEIPRCTSVSDYIARWLLEKYSEAPIAGDIKNEP